MLDCFEIGQDLTEVLFFTRWRVFELAEEISFAPDFTNPTRTNMLCAVIQKARQESNEVCFRKKSNTYGSLRQSSSTKSAEDAESPPAQACCPLAYLGSDGGQSPHCQYQKECRNGTIASSGQTEDCGVSLTSGGVALQGTKVDGHVAAADYHSPGHCSRSARSVAACRRSCSSRHIPAGSCCCTRALGAAARSCSRRSCGQQRAAWEEEDPSRMRRHLFAA